jgi:hypothetical protein
MTISKVSPEEIRNAKKAGFKKKKPKLKSTGSYNAITGSIERYNEWAREVKSAAKKGTSLKSLKEMVKRHRG